MQFSLRWLFGIVVYAAAGCALAASSGNSILLASYNVAFSALCLVALLGSVFTRRERRVFWGGCAIVAWSFMLSGFLPRNPNSLRSAVRSMHSVLTSEAAHAPDPLFYLREAGEEAFVAIGSAIGGGLLARWFWVQSAGHADHEPGHDNPFRKAG